MIKVSTHHEDITMINIRTNNRAPKYMNQKWAGLRGEICNSIIVGASNTPPSIMGRTMRQKINKNSS